MELMTAQSLKYIQNKVDNVRTQGVGNERAH